mmetsp:Transcript_51496/g.95262  ORF Transcript_51496/g.95262 Transcript_51496/m.95262 type:complete len:358 (+) Transcript_51496:65-1138(+)
MVNWNNLQQATSPNPRPTPGWLFHEICQDVKINPKDCADVAEYLMQCVCSDQLNIQLKAVLAIKHLAAEVSAFQQYMLACPAALKILQDIAAPPIVPQARAIEPQDVKTVRDATEQALKAINTPHTVEKHTESAGLKQRIQGFGNFEPPPEEAAQAKQAGVAGQVTDFVADSIGDVVDDFREKGAVGALKDATIDALDLMLDGVDAVWGWVAGKKDSDQPRICQPVAPVGGIPGGGMAPYAGAQNPAFQPPMPPASSANHYAAAFGGGVVGANNPIMMNTGAVPQAAPGVSPPAAAKAAPAEPEPAKPPPAEVVDLLSMDQPDTKGNTQGGGSADLLGDLGTSEPGGPPAGQTADLI